MPNTGSGGTPPDDNEGKSILEELKDFLSGDAAKRERAEDIQILKEEDLRFYSRRAEISFARSNFLNERNSDFSTKDANLTYM